MERAKCLLVDDRPENLVALQALLQDEPVELYSAHSGAEALELLLAHEFAVALIDVQMPGMDGFELAELMRGTQRTRAIPIIFVTAGGHDQARVFQGYEAGAVDYLVKPLNPYVVKSKLRVFVELDGQRRALAEQLELVQKGQDQIRQALEVRNRFISIAGHELRTPLTVLRLQLGMARRNLRQKGEEFGPEQLIAVVDQVERQVDRLVPLVDEMLDVSRIQTGKLEIRRESFDLAELARDVCERFQPLLREAGCELRMKLDTPAVGEWDRFRLEQVISNLLSNAARYGAGGAVVVGVGLSGGAAEVFVRDHGPGIAAADQERIFQPFERAECNGEKTGLGLGLHIAFQIVAMHAGRIRLESAVGEGATFRVELPLQVPATA